MHTFFALPRPAAAAALLTLALAAFIGCGETATTTPTTIPPAGESGTETGETGSGGEPGESGTQYGRADTARETRNGVVLTMSFDAEGDRFTGTVTNETSETAPRLRVEVHLSNGVELGPTEPSDLAAGASREVELDAAGQQFERWSVHIELGGGES